jgi:hypothetical protein
MSITERFQQVGGTVVLPKSWCRTYTTEENNRYPRKVVTFPPYYTVLYLRMKSYS